MNNYDEYDQESQALLHGVKSLSFEEVMGAKQDNLDSTKSIRKSFEEITFEKKYQRDKCLEHVDEFYISKTDVKALVDYLKDNKNSRNTFFYYENFALAIPTYSAGISPTTLAPVYTRDTANNPFTYENPLTGSQQNAHLNVSLNMRACYINVEKPGFVFFVSTKKKTISFEMRFLYSDAIDKKNYDVTPDVEADYTIESKYIAITIETSKADDILALAKELGTKDFVESQIRKAFVKKLSITKDPSELKFLYENIPDLLTEDIGRDLDYYLLFEHFKILTQYDDNEDDYLSGFRDSSNALIKNLRCLTNHHSKLLTDLTKNPALVKQVYINLDGQSEIDGMMIKNRTIYSTILSSICLINGFRDLKFTGKTFKYGNGYKLDSNVNWNNDDGNDVIFLKQQITKTKSVTKTVPTGYPGGVNRQTYQEIESYTEDADAGAYYAPLDIVAFIDYTQEKPTTEYVPAIFLKAISDEEEWIYINRMIRIGIDVAAVILGIATLGSFSGFWAIVAGVDIAVAGLDAIVQANYDEIKSASPEGEKFLEAYEQFVLVAGTATAIPLLATAPSVLAGLAKFATKTVVGSRGFVRAAITRAILEINITNFTKDTLKVIDPQELFLGFEYRSMAQKMTDVGVLFVSGTKGGKNNISFAALYKGEIIGEFNALTKNKFAKEWYRLKNDKMIKSLDNIADTIKYEKGRMGYVQGLFDNIDVNYKPKGFDFVDTPMSDYGIGYQTTIRYENSSGYFRRHFVNKTKTFIFDHAFPQKSPTWIDDVKVPLVQGKGIPTQVYITLRQMKLIGIAEGEIQMVKMSQIQNLDTAAFIHHATGGKIIRNFDSIDILAAPSNEYMKTVMTQAGYETVSGRITGKGIYQTIKQLKARNFELHSRFNNSYEAFMKEYGLSWDSKLYTDYNIEAKVKYIK